ncbi:5-formyltetrahydrofolate cyclo-ligase [Ceraceosorus bombacis]|uniref:5-formyltetrahydrofolate cyclo-ligase n=1 Tax=Ceraceosorus bombacis TaxID=401625 RepID=A0A0P1BDV0_9BASI|nr:5-formyltetrahydrofolate cyclo-ligase [Ceraceosorus bombacis]
MRMLLLRDVQEYASLKPNAYGIRELGVEMARVREDALASSTAPDLILVPGVAFDVHANRLGHGKGYYDRYLAQLHKAARARRVAAEKEPISVALSLSPQLLAEPQTVPTDENDRPLDAIVAPDRTIFAPGSRWKNA